MASSFKFYSSKTNDLIILECGANYVISASDSGYQTQETFEGFVKENLIKELDLKGVIRNAQNPIFYFLDGHKSHYSFKFIMWCREHFIIIITFFPNATRILQMCDVAMFGAGKKHYTREVQQWKIETKNAELDEVSFVKILKKVNDQFIKKESIINGFRVTGIQPFNVENVLFDHCIGFNPSTSNIAANSSSEETPPVNEILKPLTPPTSTSESVLPMTLNLDLQKKSTEPKSKRLSSLSLIEDYDDESTELSSSAQVLKAIEEIHERTRNIITPYVEMNHPNDNFLVKSIEQFLTLLSAKIKSPQAQTSLSSLALIEPFSPPVTSLPSTSRSQSSSLVSDDRSISVILSTTKPFQRSALRRNYKTLNYGVMTSDEMGKKFEDIENAKILADEEKKQKKLERQLRKEQNEVIKNIKKEKAEEKKAAKRKQLEQLPEDLPAKKRGRKPKTAA